MKMISHEYLETFMGVLGLLPLLRSISEDICSPVPDLTTKHVYIDVAIFMHRFINKNDGVFHESLQDQFLELYKSFVKATFVFDGLPLDEKKKEKRKRGENTLRAFERKVEKAEDITFVGDDESHSIVIDSGIILRPPTYLLPKRADYEMLKKYFTENSIPFVVAKYEAEAYASYLCSQEDNAILLTEDTDALMYRCPNVIFKWGSTPFLIQIDALLRTIQLTNDQFIDLCILLGTDFNSRIPYIGPQKSLKLLREFGSAKAGIAHYRQQDHKYFSEECCSTFLHEYEVTRQIVLTYCKEKS